MTVYSDFSETQKMNISENLQFIRKHRNITRKELGEMLEFRPSTIAKYEKGSGISYINLKKICRVFDIPMREITKLPGTFRSYISWIEVFDDFQNSRKKHAI